MIKTVFLDMDGVLVNFVGGLHKSLGVPYSYEDYPYEKGEWNMLTDIKINSFTGIPATFEQCNDCCTTNFWKHLEWMPDGMYIIHKILCKFHRNQIYLLTTPMPNLESASGKMMWVSDNLPLHLKHTIITQAPKHLLARPDTLLIDDKDQNIDEFREAGGQGILVPRPWNRDYGMARHTVEVIKECLENLE